MSFFRIFNPKQLFVNRIPSRFHSSKRVFSFSNKAIFSSMLFSVSLMNIFKQYFHYNDSKLSQIKEEPEQKSTKIEWKSYSENAYEECLKENGDVIVVLNLSDYNDNFKNILAGDMYQIAQIQKHFSKKKLNFLSLDLKTEEEKKKFEEKHQIKLSGNILFLIKSRYNDSLVKLNFNEYLSRKGYLLALLNKISKISDKNFKDFSNVLKTSSPDSLVIILYNPKDSPNYELLKKKYAKLVNNQHFFESQSISFLMIKEKNTKDNFKLVEPIPGDIFLAQKSSILIHNKWNLELENHQKFQITKSSNLTKFQTIPETIEDIARASQQINVFTIRGLENVSDFAFTLELDLNQLDEQKVNMIYEIMAEVHEEILKNHPNIAKTVSFSKTNRALKKKAIKISIKNEQKYFKQIMEREVKSLKELETLYKDEPIPDLNEPMTLNYIFGKGQQLNKENVVKFILNVLDNKVPQSFQSQKPPKFRTYSKKVVGKNFKKEIIDNDKTQVLMIYSKHCFACKKLGKNYEDLALEFIKSNRNDVEFNRMNSENNDVDCMRNFHYTPVFLVFKPGMKKNPCIYLNEKMTPDMLKTFVENSIEYKILSEETVKKAYEELIRPKD